MPARRLIHQLGLHSFAGGVLVTNPVHGLRQFDVIESVNNTPVSALRDVTTTQNAADTVVRVRRRIDGRISSHVVHIAAPVPRLSI